MDRWREALDSGPAMTSLGQVEAAVEQLTEGLPETQLGELARLRRVVELVRSHLTTADEQLVSQFALVELQKRLHNLLIEVQGQITLRDGGGDVSLTVVNDVADEVLDSLAAGWFPLAPEEAAAAVRTAAETLSEEAASMLRSLKGQAESTKRELQEVGPETEKVIQERDTAITALEARITAADSTIEQLVTRLDSALQDHTGRFDDAQEKRLQDFTTLTTEQQTAGAAAIAAIEDDAKKRGLALKQAGDERLAELDERRKEAEKLVGTIAREGMAAGYQGEADGETKQANWLRVLAIVLALIAAGVLAWGVFHATSDSINAGEVTTRIALTAVLGGVAGYTARESAKHRDAAQRLRSIQLSLASIGPYLAQLDEARRAAVIEAFSYVFFAPSDRKATSDEQGPNQAQALFLDFLSKVSPPAK